jgi:hypothetical protein
MNCGQAAHRNRGIFLSLPFLTSKLCDGGSQADLVAPPERPLFSTRPRVYLRAVERR